MSNCGLRWQNDTLPEKLKLKLSKWQVTNENLENLISSLPSVKEAARINKYYFLEDRKRSLAGYLIICYLVSTHFKIDIKNIDIKRNKYGKPYFHLPGHRILYFNISHHGNWVVACSSLTGEVGIDVTSYETERNKLRSGAQTSQFFEAFKSHFTKVEKQYIAGNLRTFYQNWALKESYIKAIGKGLSHPLASLQFTFSKMPDYDVTLEVAKASQNTDPLKWESSIAKFSLEELDCDHCVAICSFTDFDFEQPWKECSISDDGKLVWY